MFLALENRQAIHVRPEAAVEKRIPVVEKMLGRDRRTKARPMRPHHFNAVCGGDVLQNHLESRYALQERQQDRINKCLLAIKHIDFRTWKLAMHEKRHSAFRHHLKNGPDLIDIRYAGGGICRGVRWIKLGGRKNTGLVPGNQIRGVCCIR